MKLPNDSRLRSLVSPIPLLLLALLVVAVLVRLAEPSGSVPPTGDGSLQAPEPVLADRPAAVTHVCPMHPEVVSAGPGKCPICGMDLVAKTTGLPEPAMMVGGASYVCPMHPAVVGASPASARSAV